MTDAKTDAEADAGKNERQWKVLLGDIFQRVLTTMGASAVGGAALGVPSFRLVLTAVRRDRMASTERTVR
jgi:hypothetical protein